MKAQPEPMVSGRYFFPKAPLLWTKWMPACAVMSRNWMRCAEAEAANKSKKRETSILRIIVTLRRWRFDWPSFARRGRVEDPCPHEGPSPHGLRLAAPTHVRGWLGVRCCPRD